MKKGRRRKSRGPSRRLVAWRKFVVETVICLVLIAAIVSASLLLPRNIFTGWFVLSAAAAVVAIVRYER